MPTAAVTIHWHGILQKTTPWMDGVPYVTQCPIQPNSKFRYNFPADTNGTFFYHAHIPYLHSNGLYGALIVRTPRATWDPNDVLHDVDVPSHVVKISDWNHYPAEAFHPGFFMNSSHHPHRPDVFLINGRGWYHDSITQTNVQPAEFHVTSGKTYRFRLIATTTSTCCFKFAVQDHTLRVVALDGYPCTPMNVSTVVMSSGQRTDVILIPNDDPSSYKDNVFHIVVKGMDSCNKTNLQTATLRYDNSSKDPKPTDLTALHDKPPFLNNHELGGCDLEDNICSDTLPPASGFQGVKLSPGLIPNYTFIINPSFHTYGIDEIFVKNSYLPFFVPRGAEGAYAAVLNKVSSLLPPVPLLTQERDLPPDIPICHGNCTKSEDPICHCMNILEVELNSLVDIQFEEDIIHPIHIHGHHFTVVEPQLVFDDSAPLNILRDVVHAPLDKLARVRFRADNPGFWIMHCHFSAHFEAGMFLIFKVGDNSTFRVPPPAFPKCGNFLPAVETLL